MEKLKPVDVFILYLSCLCTVILQRVDSQPYCSGTTECKTELDTLGLNLQAATNWVRQRVGLETAENALKWSSPRNLRSKRDQEKPRWPRDQLRDISNVQFVFCALLYDLSCVKRTGTLFLYFFISSIFQFHFCNFSSI